MNKLQKLDQHELVLKILDDGMKIFSDKNIDINQTEFTDVDLNEYEYYIHNVGFYLVHTLTWTKQLDISIDLLTNFDYSKKIDSNKADHLIYNIENYFIRINSVYDRILQIVNAVFHIGVHEESVGHSIIISNSKVAHRADIQKQIKTIKRIFYEYSKVRNTLIHKHSWRDLELQRIERLYQIDIESDLYKSDYKSEVKQFRSRLLREYTVEKKSEFLNLNEKIYTEVDKLLTLLQPEYERQKQRLKASPW